MSDPSESKRERPRNVNHGLSFQAKEFVRNNLGRILPQSIQTEKGRYEIRSIFKKSNSGFWELLRNIRVTRYLVVRISGESWLLTCLFVQRIDDAFVDMSKKGWSISSKNSELSLTEGYILTEGEIFRNERQARDSVVVGSSRDKRRFTRELAS